MRSIPAKMLWLEKHGKVHRVYKVGEQVDFGLHATWHCYRKRWIGRDDRIEYYLCERGLFKSMESNVALGFYYPADEWSAEIAELWERILCGATV